MKIFFSTTIVFYEDSYRVIELISANIVPSLDIEDNIRQYQCDNSFII